MSVLLLCSSAQASDLPSCLLEQVICIGRHNHRHLCGTESMDSKLLDDSLHKSKLWNNGIGYAMATILLRLPGYAPMLAFNHIVDVPLIAPHAKLTRNQVCKLAVSASVSCSNCLLTVKTRQLSVVLRNLLLGQRLQNACHSLPFSLPFTVYLSQAARVIVNLVMVLL